jgi:surface antigen
MLGFRRMRLIVAGVALGLAGLALAGCSSTTSGTQSPQALGLVADGSAGSTPMASFAASGLNTSAQKRATETEVRALEFGRTGIPVAWKEGKSRGEVTPGAPYQVNASSCRDYTHSVSVDGGPPVSGRATACRQANGTWQTIL